MFQFVFVEKYHILNHKEFEFLMIKNGVYLLFMKKHGNKMN